MNKRDNKLDKDTFIHEDTNFTGGYKKSVFTTLKIAYSQHKITLAITIILGLIARTLLLMNANIMGFWADSLCKPNTEVVCHKLPHILSKSTNHDFVIILIYFSIIGFIFNTIFRILIARIGTHAISLIYDETTYRTSRLPLSFFDRTPVGRIIGRFSSDYSAIFTMCGGPMGEFLCLVFDLILMITLASITSPLYIPLLILTIFLNYLLYKKNKNKLRLARRSVASTRTPAISHFAETVQGVLSIRIFKKATIFLNRFYELYKISLTERLRSSIAIQIFSFQMVALTSLLLLVSSVSGIFLFIMD